MPLQQKLLDELVVEPGASAGLAHRSTSATRFDWLGGAHPGDVAEHQLAAFRSELEAAQELLYASDRYAVLVVLQGIDAAGKDGTIKHVMSGVNPQGCEVVSFKQPSEEELGHDFLWRCVRALPARGRIGIFNRSYYEEVLVTRVHPDLLVAEHLPASEHSARTWSGRYEDINALERHLERNGTRIVKVFLHVSKAEQRKRLLERLSDPAKQWKFSRSDLSEHSLFEEYQRAYEEALTATSSPWAPWYVVPADHKHTAHALVGGIVADTIAKLDLQLPALDPVARDELEAARRTLAAEGD